MTDVLMASIAATVVSVVAALAVIAGVLLLLAGIDLCLKQDRRRRRARELERLEHLNTWHHYPAPQNPAELEQQVAGSREAREWARRNPELARELARALTGHE